MSWLLLHHLGDRLLGGTGPSPGPGGRQLLLRLELRGLLHGDALGLALGRRGVGRLGHGGQGRACAGTGCAINKFNVQKIFGKNICVIPPPM